MTDSVRGWISKHQSSLLHRLYDNLTWDDTVQAADLIFVMAGRMERKQYGLDLYRAGIAPRLVLSIARFEVSKMRKLSLEGLDDLILLREKTPPDERHFFLKLSDSGSTVEKVRLVKWNTYGEALGLRKLVEEEKPRKLMVVSTDVHLRRVRLTCREIFRGVAVELLYCAVPSRLACFTKHRWWGRRDDRKFVVKEWMKLLAYRAILLMPGWAVRWLMRLKR